MSLVGLTIEEAHDGLIKKEFSAKELCRSFFKKIEQNKEIFAYLTLNKERALSQAEEVDDLISSGRGVPILGGVPAAVKDNILVEDVKCTAGSKILESYIAPYNATVINKLKNEEVVILGKTNMDEFAMGSSCENSAFGPTKNPHDLGRVPGGSSGGSAAAIAADLAVFSLGSDTGGSVRQPASFCGVVGFKPTYGAVSRYGLMAMASSLDQIGPITKTVRDAEIVFDFISGKDPLDSTSVEKPERSKEEIKNLKIGVPREYFGEGLDLKVKESVEKALKKLESLGIEIKEISLPHTEYALASYYLVMPSEVSANLARYDGIKYGASFQEADNLIDLYFKTRGKNFGKEVRRRIMLGTYSLSSGYYEAYYLRAQKVRTLIKKDFEEAFKKVDLIATPTAPTTAFKLGEKIEDPLSMYLSDIYIVSANLAGLPAISLPCGKVDGLPVGFQIMGDVFEDYKVLELGKTFEKL